MAKPGAGKRKMAAQRKKQWNATTSSLKSTGRALRGGKRRKKNGCYVATCVYGSYDCPEVWVLRRYRDEVLEDNVVGRMFVSAYYLLSPLAVKIFGKSQTIRNYWKKILDKKVMVLLEKGFEDRPYSDM